MSVTKDDKPLTLEERVLAAKTIINEMQPLVTVASALLYNDVPTLYKDRTSTRRQYLRTWRQARHTHFLASRIIYQLNNYVAKLQKEINK